MTVRVFALVIAGLFLAAVIGCGSNTQTSNNPPTGSPAPTPTPGPNTAQYEAALLRPGSTGAVAGGQIIVNMNGTSGVGQVTAKNGAASSTYTITFKPFTNSGSALTVGTVTSDASGNINGSFTFPQKSTFSGVFHLSAGTNSFNTEIDPMDSGVDDNTNFVFNVPLVQAGKVTPAISSGVMIGTDPLTSGTIVAGSGKLHVELHGAAANATYQIVECGVNDGSSCQAVNGNGTITTDASGNATMDQAFFTVGDPAVVFELFHSTQLQYVSGFTVH